MANLVIEACGGLPVARREVELVERKGTRHPDSICDAVMEAACYRAVSFISLEKGQNEQNLVLGKH
jgi:S-adenosylmethionine synthetase